MRRTISKLGFLGACFSGGQPIKGVELGPKAIRESGVFKALEANYGVKTIDYGDVNQVKESTIRHKTHIKNLQILDPSLKKLNDRITQLLKKIDDTQQTLLTVGGDHSIATGTIHGLLSKYQNLKIIWVDAHGDLIDASKSKYNGYHGMPLSHLLGVNDGGAIPGFEWMKKRLRPENVVHIGMRDIDEDQWGTIQRLGIKCFTPDHIDMYGIGEVMRQALHHLDPITTANPQDHRSAPFHISFDIDAMDPIHAQATGTKFRGGLNFRQACHIVRRTCWERKVVSMDLVEINPKLREQEEPARRRYRGEEELAEDLGTTVGMGVDLIDSLFKKYLSL